MIGREAVAHRRIELGRAAEPNQRWCSRSGSRAARTEIEERRARLGRITGNFPQRKRHQGGGRYGGRRGRASAIWWRQLVPQAASRVSGGSRTSGATHRARRFQRHRGCWPRSRMRRPCRSRSNRRLDLEPGISCKALTAAPSGGEGLLMAMAVQQCGAAGIGAKASRNWVRENHRRGLGGGPALTDRRRAHQPGQHGGVPAGHAIGGHRRIGLG